MQDTEDLARKIYADAMSLTETTFDNRNAARRFEERVFLSVVALLEQGHTDHKFIALSALEWAKRRL